MSLAQLQDLHLYTGKYCACFLLTVVKGIIPMVCPQSRSLQMPGKLAAEKIMLSKI